jgi:hypothetical protein
MKYPASHLTPFLPALPAKAPFASGHRSLVPHTARLLNTHNSIACTLLNSLASLFAHAFVCFQSFADSFCKTPGVGYPRQQLRYTRSRSQEWLAELHNFGAPITTFRINTCISVASKRLYPPLESTLMKKGGEGGGGLLTQTICPFVAAQHAAPIRRFTPSKAEGPLSRLTVNCRRLAQSALCEGPTSFQFLFLPYCQLKTVSCRLPSIPCGSSAERPLTLR